MPFPILPALALGAGAAESIFGKPNIPTGPPPEFFGPQFIELLNRRKQQIQAQYGDMLTGLRNNLADLGLGGNPGATVDAATKLNIGQGQDILNSVGDLYNREYYARQAFDMNRYLSQLDTQNRFNIANYGNTMGTINAGLNSIGQYYQYLQSLNQNNGTNEDKITGKIPPPPK